jgi:hypothetical protein
MKHKDCQFTTKKRRGLSTIVGGLIFVMLMVATFSVLSIALTTQTEIVETSRAVAATELKQQQEKFVFNAAQQLPGGFLEVELTNQGQNVAEMFTMIMTNKTDSGEPTQTIRIPSATSFLLPGDNIPTNVVSSLDLRMADPGAGNRDDYVFKVISSLGTIKKISLSCDGDTGLCGTITPPAVGPVCLSAQLFLDGPTGINTKTSTVIMFVQNCGIVPLEDVRPVDPCPSAVFPSIPTFTSHQGFTGCGLTPPTDALCGSGPAPGNNDDLGVCLGPGQSVLFKWDGVVEGDVDDEFFFCNQVTGEEYDDTVVPPSPVFPGACDELTIIDPNDCDGCGSGGPGGGDEHPLDEKFITRPELFLTIPSPFGLGGDGGGGDAPIIRGLWGANVVNPTDTTMLIHKITITAYPPASNDNNNIIKSKNTNPIECSPQDISPGTGTIPGTEIQEAGDWTCPGANTIMWRNYTSPITLLPKETFPFLVKLEGHSPMNTNFEAILVDSTVFTTSGSFGKGNYQSTAYSLGMLANVYETSDPLNPLDLTNIVSSRLNIDSGSVQKFHIVLAEQDVVASSYIKAGSKIIVNVPRAFTLVDVIEGETTGIIIAPLGVEPSVVIHPDLTTQIIATITDDIGDQITAEAVVLTFEATAPVVETKKLMVMYTLGNGEGPGGVSVGPLSEIILQVVPP